MNRHSLTAYHDRRRAEAELELARLRGRHQLERHDVEPGPQSSTSDAFAAGVVLGVVALLGLAWLASRSDD